MFLHRAKSGDDFTDIMRDVNEGTLARDATSGAAGSGESATTGTKPDDDDAEAAMAAMLRSGKTPEAIAEDLARFVMQSLAQSGDLARFRTAGGRNF